MLNRRVFWVRHTEFIATRAVILRKTAGHCRPWLGEMDGRFENLRSLTLSHTHTLLHEFSLKLIRYVAEKLYSIA